MSITNCPECRNQVSTKAASCPNCGYNFNAVRKATTRKGCGIALAMLLGFFIIIIILSQNDDKNNEKHIIALKEAHCKLKWADLNKTQKELVLNEFIDKDLENTRGTINYIVRESVKYPGSIEDNYAQGKIIDINKGIIEYQSSFTSENKIGMKVKGHYWYKTKYTAGCKPATYISFDIE